MINFKVNLKMNNHKSNEIKLTCQTNNFRNSVIN